MYSSHNQLNIKQFLLIKPKLMQNIGSGMNPRFPECINYRTNDLEYSHKNMQICVPLICPQLASGTSGDKFS